MQTSNDNTTTDSPVELTPAPSGARVWIAVLVAGIVLCAGMIWWVAAQVERQDAVARANAETADASTSDVVRGGEVRVDGADAGPASYTGIAARVGTVEIATAELDAEVARHVDLLRRRGEPPVWAQVEAHRRRVLEARIEDALAGQALAAAAAAIEPSRVEAALESRIAEHFGGRRDRFVQFLAARGQDLRDVEREIRESIALRERLDTSALDEATLQHAWRSLAPALHAPSRTRVDLVGLEVPADADAATRRRLEGDARALQRALSMHTHGSSLTPVAERYGASVVVDGDWVLEGTLSAPVEQWLERAAHDAGGEPRPQVPEPLDADGRLWVARVHAHRAAGVRQLDEVRDLVIERVVESRMAQARHQLAVVTAVSVPVERVDSRWGRRLQRRLRFDAAD